MMDTLRCAIWLVGLDTSISFLGTAAVTYPYPVSSLRHCSFELAIEFLTLQPAVIYQ